MLPADSLLDTAVVLATGLGDKILCLLFRLSPFPIAFHGEHRGAHGLTLGVRRW
jgi:hypothetical protein